MSTAIQRLFDHTIVLWRTINLGRPVIELTSKCELALCSTNPIFDFCHSCHRDSDNQN
jgi:hypothetical protein